MIKQLIQAPKDGDICRFEAVIASKCDDGTPINLRYDIHYLALLDDETIKPVIFSENGAFEVFCGEIYDRQR